MVHTLDHQWGTERMKWLILINRGMREEICELSLAGTAGHDNWINLIYTLLTKWYEQRPRDRKCGLWGIVNRPGKLEQRLPRDMKTLWIKRGKKGSSWEFMSPRCSGYSKKPPDWEKKWWRQQCYKGNRNGPCLRSLFIFPPWWPAWQYSGTLCFLSIYYLLLWFAQGTENYKQRIINHSFIITYVIYLLQILC